MKPWYTSKTLWLNALALAIGAAADNVQQLNGLVGVSVFKLLAFGLPVLNGVVRFATTQALQIRRPGDGHANPQ